MRAHVIDRQNVRMIERAGSASFLLETFQPLGIYGECGRQDFYGHIAPKTRVAGAVDFAHTARTKGSDDFIWPKSYTGCQTHLFKSAFQLTRFIGAEPPSPTVATTERLPSGVTS